MKTPRNILTLAIAALAATAGTAAAGEIVRSGATKLVVDKSRYTRLSAIDAYQRLFQRADRVCRSGGLRTLDDRASDEACARDLAAKALATVHTVNAFDTAGVPANPAEDVLN